jgi:hypothetical protein
MGAYAGGGLRPGAGRSTGAGEFSTFERVAGYLGADTYTVSCLCVRDFALGLAPPPLSSPGVWLTAGAGAGE